MEPIAVRCWGERGALVVALHGGPGAPGSVAGLAEGISHEFRVLEPFQRAGGSVPLSVDRHIEDLATVMPGPAAMVGWSWGAMLALSFAVANPTLVRSLALVGCGTYDRTSRDAYHRAMDERLGTIGRRTRDELRTRLSTASGPERDKALGVVGRLIADAQSVDPVDTERSVILACGAGSDVDTWIDVLRRQDEQLEPAAFAAIRVPVMMIHGDRDPHPGRATYDVLRRHIPQLQFVEITRCGHAPWEERSARDAFFEVLARWLRANG